MQSCGRWEIVLRAGRDLRKVRENTGVVEELLPVDTGFAHVAQTGDEELQRPTVVRRQKVAQCVHRICLGSNRRADGVPAGLSAAVCRETTGGSAQCTHDTTLFREPVPFRGHRYQGVGTRSSRTTVWNPNVKSGEARDRSSLSRHS